jgi:ATP-binding protein involved in chromosome partitioning
MICPVSCRIFVHAFFIGTPGKEKQCQSGNSDSIRVFMVTKDEIIAALDISARGLASAVKAENGQVSLMLDMSDTPPPDRGALAAKLEQQIKSMPGVDTVRVMQTAQRIVPNLIAVASGKGGVGKSTLSANLAVAMARAGRKVGLVDADIYGPSQSRLMGAGDQKPESAGQKMYPVTGAGGVPFLSMAQLVKPGQAIAWRGPMAGNALSQLIDAHWGAVREIIIDLPPGTGDIQLSMVQKHKPIGAVIISTPQDLALIDAMRAISFFEQANVPIIGVVENMSGYICQNCGDVSNPFGAGGAQAAADELGLPFLGRIPLDIEVRRSSDDGAPIAMGDGPVASAFAAIAAAICDWSDQRKTAE